MDRCALLALSVLGLVLLLSWFPVGLSASSVNGIEILIKAGATLQESSVTATGRIVNPIADSERESFNIGSDAALKRAVGKYFGKEPNAAYLRSPTPGEDMYTRYGWPQVERVLELKAAKILDITSKPTIVTRKTVKNNSNQTGIFSTTISEQVSNSVSHEWSNSKSVSVGQSISYGINVKVSVLEISAGGETTFDFTSNWGESKTVTEETKLGTETGVTVDLKPEESAIVELSASSGKMRVRIMYEAYLTGGTAVQYNSKYQGHWHWWLPIESVLAGFNKVQITENIEVGYYTNAAASLTRK